MSYNCEIRITGTTIFNFSLSILCRMLGNRLCRRSSYSKAWAEQLRAVGSHTVILVRESPSHLFVASSPGCLEFQLQFGVNSVNEVEVDGEYQVCNEKHASSNRNKLPQSEGRSCILL